jgi:predicted nucleic acid-binding protein
LEASPLVVETSTLINLVATDEFDAIVQELGRPVVICESAPAECLLRAEERTGPLVPANLDDLLRMNALLRSATCEAVEEDLFVELATALTDAEAMAVTIAASRNYALASDDHKVRHIFAERVRSTDDLVSTSEILQTWVRQASVPRPRVRQALHRIAARARFRPKRDDPTRAWWDDMEDVSRP